MYVCVIKELKFQDRHTVGMIRCTNPHHIFPTELKVFHVPHVKKKKKSWLIYPHY